MSALSSTKLDSSISIPFVEEVLLARRVGDEASRIKKC